MMDTILGAEHPSSTYTLSVTCYLMLHSILRWTWIWIENPVIANHGIIPDQTIPPAKLRNSGPQVLHRRVWHWFHGTFDPSLGQYYNNVSKYCTPQSLTRAVSSVPVHPDQARVLIGAGQLAFRYLVWEDQSGSSRGTQTLQRAEQGRPSYFLERASASIKCHEGKRVASGDKYPWHWMMSTNLWCDVMYVVT